MSQIVFLGSVLVVAILLIVLDERLGITKRWFGGDE